MRVLVTGAAGFVGSHLAEALLAAGHAVTGLVRPGSPPRWLDETGVEVVDCGMDSAEAMRDAVGGAEMIYHVAGVTKAYRPEAYFTGNAAIARNLAEAVRKYGEDVKALVAVSSQAAGGPHPGREGSVETDEPRPVSRYGEAKLEAEAALRGLAGMVPVSIARPSMVYGPRDTAFVPLYRGARLGLFPVPGNPDILMSIVHVHDLVYGLVTLGTALLDGRAESPVYYLSGQTASWREIGEAVGRGVGRDQRMLTVPLWLLRMVAVLNETGGRMGLPAGHLVRDKSREAVQPGWVCSHARAATEFGYAPQVGLDEGMRATVQWCRENGML